MTKFVLRLYIAGNTAAAARAQQNLAPIREAIGSRGWNLEIIDVLTHPELAEKASVLATPMLSYEGPARSRRIIGDLSDTKRVLAFLGIERDEQG